MGFLNRFIPHRKSATSPTEPMEEVTKEYVLPELKPVPGLSSLCNEPFLVERKKQEEELKKYGIARVTAGHI